MWLPNQGGYGARWEHQMGMASQDRICRTRSARHSRVEPPVDVQGDLPRKPHSWPEAWYNQAAGRYVWPAFLGNDATTPDEEV